MPPRLDVGESGGEGGRGRLLVALLSALIVVAAGAGGIVVVAVVVVRWRSAARHEHSRDTVSPAGRRGGELRRLVERGEGREERRGREKEKRG